MKPTSKNKKASSSAANENNSGEKGVGSELVLLKDAEDEPTGCPLETVLEFLEAVMKKDYKNALKLAKEVQKHEPNNELVKEYEFILGDIIKIDEDASSESSGSPSEEEESESSSSSSSEDETSSAGDDDSSWESM